MKDRKLPKSLQSRVLDYYTNYFKKKTLFNEQEILSSLSLPLRNEIVEHSNKKVVAGLSMFQSLDSAVKTALLHHMRPVLQVRQRRVLLCCCDDGAVVIGCHGCLGVVHLLTVRIATPWLLVARD